MSSGLVCAYQKPHRAEEVNCMTSSLQPWCELAAWNWPPGDGKKPALGLETNRAYNRNAAGQTTTDFKTTVRAAYFPADVLGWREALGSMRADGLQVVA